jgi:hypothetical protein
MLQVDANVDERRIDVPEDVDEKLVGGRPIVLVRLEDDRLAPVVWDSDGPKAINPVRVAESFIARARSSHCG